MAAIEEKTYLLFNYSSSRRVVALRDSSVVLEGGSKDAPTSYPFTMSELQHINNSSSFIKVGILRPSDDEAEKIYSALRITNWKDILTDEQIEDIILYPTPEKLEKLLNIKSSTYFERVYGIYIGLRNADAPIISSVNRLISGRHKELAEGKRDTGFIVRPTDTQVQTDKNTAEIDAMKKQIEELTAALAAVTKPDKTADDRKTPPAAGTETTRTESEKKTRGSKKMKDGV